MTQDNSSGYAALRQGAAVIDRDTVGLIELRGADRLAYLQGILTNDVASLAPGRGCYAAMLTAHGRMITDMFVFHTGDATLLEVPRPLAESLREHLDRFVFTEDVQVRDLTNEAAIVGVFGPRALDLVARIGTFGALAIPTDALGVPGVDLILRPADRERGREALNAEGAVTATPADVEAVRIESGRPLFGVDMNADTIPLEAGLEDRAISRSKGCYVGQEVIVRVLDRGHGRVAKRLVGLTLDPAVPVAAAGSAVTVDHKDAGRVTSAVHSPALGRPIALAYLHRDHTAPGTLVQVEGRDAVVALLPFV